MKYAWIIILTSLCCSLSTPCIAVNSKSQKELAKEKKVGKQLNKWTKRINKWSSSEEGLVNTSKPWLSLALGVGSIFMFYVGIIASFGIAGPAAALAFIASIALGVLGLWIGISSFNFRGQSEKPKLTATVSILGMITSGFVLGLLAIGLINVLANL